MGGGSTWSKLKSNSTSGVDNEFWLGTVTTTGSSTITVTYSGSVSSDWIELSAQEYSNGFGASASWTTDTTGVTNTTSSSTTVALPSLSPSGSGELYVGMAFVSNYGRGWLHERLHVRSHAREQHLCLRFERLEFGSVRRRLSRRRALITRLPSY